MPYIFPQLLPVNLLACVPLCSQEFHHILTLFCNVSACLRSYYVDERNVW
uniref:DN104942_c0_g1_i1 n=1 Tax=Ceratitis capitata TaxID=7213 RepID=A0A6B7K5R4_CERCA|nr:DN104942_c0_g1_i1 [Ceratitis capitata]